VLDSGHGIYFKDTDGKEYIDGASQLLCINLGYGQNEIADAVHQEMLELPYGMLFHGFSNTAVIECSRKLSEIAPVGLDHFNFTTGGSESIDVALRLARLYWHSKGRGKYKVIGLFDSYHGTAGAGLSATGAGRGFYERGAAPMMPGFLHVPSYYCYRCMFGLKYPECNIRCARFLADVIQKEGSESVAAFIAEPELGVGGMIAPPREYWSIVRDICNEHEVLLIVDEVMTGFGRTGKMFAVEHWGLIPDMMTMAKGITSAYMPFGAVAFNDEMWQALKGRNFISYTYAGHPVCAAAAVKTMEIYHRDKVVENAAKVGEYARARLQREFVPLPCVGEIGGLGLMLGIEIVADKAQRAVFPRELNVIQKIQDRALEKGLFVRTSDIGSTPGERIAFAPPLTITTQEVDKALDILYPIVADLKPQ
jgi:adenosylmethionine-8-amino-7-oxononanoate aminotransferase